MDKADAALRAQLQAASQQVASLKQDSAAAAAAAQEALRDTGALLAASQTKCQELGSQVRFLCRALSRAFRWFAVAWGRRLHVCCPCAHAISCSIVTPPPVSPICPVPMCAPLPLPTYERVHHRAPQLEDVRRSEASARALCDATAAAGKQREQEQESALARRTQELESVSRDVAGLTRDNAALALDCERLRLEVASVREDLAAARASGSSGSEQLRVKSEELLRCEAARATAEALCSELRSGLAEAKVRWVRSVRPRCAASVPCLGA